MRSAAWFVVVCFLMGPYMVLGVAGMLLWPGGRLVSISYFAMASIALIAACRFAVQPRR